MNKPIIKVENLSKRYRIGAKREELGNIREAILNTVKAPFKNFFRLKKLTNFQDVGNGASNDILWALKDVSFEIQEGEVVGIIGSNGSGKSTLLKILSRITEPTKGCAEIKGRVASLLEVGTGFHEELTGRENIYLNGAILGMRKREIDKKFDEIVAFSEIEKFLDTPVKHYSSGMYVRLAFAVAAHLDPEILLVDEVLAVGDIAFQKKCLGKMSDLAKGGRTVLFVSHNMGAIQTLCPKTIWINNGNIKEFADSQNVISKYLFTNSTQKKCWEQDQCNSSGKDLEAKVIKLRVLSCDGHPNNIIGALEDFQLEVIYKVMHPMKDLTVSMGITNNQGVRIFYTHEGDNANWGTKVRRAGKYISSCIIPGGLLRPGFFFVSITLYIENVRIIESHEEVVSFEISNIGSLLQDDRKGVIAPILNWNVRYDDHD